MPMWRWRPRCPRGCLVTSNMRCMFGMPCRPCMRHQVEDGSRKSCHTAGHEHVAKLRNGGIRKDLFDIRLSDSDRGSKKGGQGSDDCNYGQRDRRMFENHV